MAHHNRDDIFLDRLIAEKFSVSFMNNSKWVKLLSVLIENSSIVKECRVKPIWDDEAPHRYLLFDENAAFGFDYYDAAMEAMISGKPQGWYAYKEIEWLDFPHITTDKEEQDLPLIKTLIDNVGEFNMELTLNNLRLYCYFRK